MLQLPEREPHRHGHGPGFFDSWLQAVLALVCLLVILFMAAGVFALGGLWSDFHDFKERADLRSARRDAQNERLSCQADQLLGNQPRGTPCPTVPPNPDAGG